MENGKTLFFQAVSSPSNLPPEADDLDVVLPSRAKARCAAPECERFVLSRGLCGRHYKQQWAKNELPPQKLKVLRMTTMRITLTRSQRAEILEEAKLRGVSQTMMVRKMVSVMLKRLKAKRAQDSVTMNTSRATSDAT